MQQSGSRPTNSTTKINILRHQREAALDAHAEAEAHIGFLMDQIAMRDQKIADLQQQLDKVKANEPDSAPDHPEV